MASRAETKKYLTWASVFRRCSGGRLNLIRSSFQLRLESSEKQDIHGKQWISSSSSTGRREEGVGWWEGRWKGATCRAWS
ncbi:hypothetical protein GUJ93_ZPchr0012g20244 [Zizania palustris]|uniref:Uncharacterized protein n=1 Tax=Zizania palustris TaxID=103762 RepID=A0A8J5WRM8_ZIZPA|nr:hypothetical protein GUJ93_ZPchr0012g20244 [Zizania palustris]